MSIANELSSDVAAAVLAAGEGQAQGDANERVELVLEVHSTLRRLSADYRRRGRDGEGEQRDPPFSEGASSGRR
jgi:hypothetical protein